MNQNNALNNSGCWYSIFDNEDFSHITCRTGMTHISFDIKFENKTFEELKVDIDNLDNIYNNIMIKKDTDYQTVWDSLGYCGMMFLDWLKEAKKYILDESKHDLLTVIQIYIAGIKLVNESLTNNDSI
jgi:hypothetical protein